MENQPTMQPTMQPASSKKFPVGAVLISVILTAIIVGGGVYFWQSMLLNEAEENLAKAVVPITPEAAVPQATTVKPTVTSPQNWTTAENALDGVKITGKAAPNSTVWLFQVSEMDAWCLHLASALTLGDKADTSGNFEIYYIPSGNEESWPSEFAVVALDDNQKYQLRWVTGSFCAPEEATSDYFHWTLQQTATPVLFQDDAYHFRIIGTTGLCADYYSIKAIEPLENSIKSYGVFAPGSKVWGMDFPASTYAIYTQAAYDKLPVNELQDKPEIILYLDDGNLLTRRHPQDSPPDMPQGCQFNFEKF